MVETDVEMGGTGKLLIDEVMSDQENVGNNELHVEEAGDKQEKLSDVVNEDNKNQNEIGVEEEKLNENAEEERKLSKNAEEETHVDQSEQGLPVNETHGSEKDAASMGDDKTNDIEKDASMDDDKTHDMEKNVASMDDEKTHDMEKDASMDDDAFMKMEQDKNVGDDAGDEKHQELATPVNTHVIPSANKAKDHTVEMLKNEIEDTQVDEGYESGTADDQEAFMKELETFCKEKSLEFKPPKFYGQPLNCLKLWRSVIKLGGYDRVTGLKLWRQVGESFHPPKTCTTVSWTFRIFYEKALLEYERHKMHNGELELPLATVLPEAATIENEVNGYQTPGSGRARRDAAARAMQGWHDQRLFGYGEDKNVNGSQKREKSLKSIGSLKQKRPSEVEHPVKAARTETSRHMVPTVSDLGPPADWVKVNVQETKDSFEVYALVPGLLREEVRVQSDPAGRLVITGQPEQPDNPWGITAFKKVITLPSRIDPLHTSAIVSLHGRLHVRVPFEQSNI